MTEYLKEIPILDHESTSSVEWTGDGIQYDLNLLELGLSKDLRKFFVINPNLQDDTLLEYIFDIPEMDECVVWVKDGQWVAKLFSYQWTEFTGYYEIALEKPKFVWIKNTHFDRLMTFENDPYGIYEPEVWDSQYRLVWYIDPRFNPTGDKIWVMSCFPMGVTEKGIKDMGYLTPEVDIEFNPRLSNLGIDPEEYYPAYYDLDKTCAWYLDPKHTDKDIWLLKFKPKYKKEEEYNYLGTISPKFFIEYNSDLGDINYDLSECNVRLENFRKENVWLLDRKYLKDGEEDIIAFKISVQTLSEITSKIEQVVIGYVEPSFEVEINKDLASIDCNIEYVPPWYDLKYEHVWYLDKKHLTNNSDDIWYLKATCIDQPEGTKFIDYVSPRHFYEYNPSLPKMEFNIDYAVPWYDFSFEHKWMLDSKYSPNGDEIWAAKLFLTDNPTGEKTIGTITPVIKDVLDVIFISYHEPNAEENWQRVLEKAPWAKRVNGVKGIFEAHKQAALLSETDMFYVVDGDAWLVDDWNFDYQPGIFDRDCAYIWYSRNPVNDLTYGYGGVKLFSKAMMINAQAMTKLDMTTSVMPKLKVIEKVSNETRFNADEFSTWRSAFRECVKLFYNTKNDDKNLEHRQRLDKWLSSNQGDFNEYAVKGARMAIEYAEKNLSNYDLLLKINDMTWLKREFKKS